MGDHPWALARTTPRRLAGPWAAGPGGRWAGLLGLLLSLLLLLPAPVSALDGAPPGAGPRAMAFEVFEDTTGRLPLAELHQATGWQARGDGIFNAGFSHSTWWLRLEARNPTPQPLPQVLDLRTPLTDFVDVHLVRADGSSTALLASGDRRPFQTRGLGLRSPALMLSLAPGEQAWLYVRLAAFDGTHESVQPRLLSPTQAMEAAQNDGLGLGLYFGALAAMLIYNVFLWIGTRHASLGWFAAYLASFFVVVLTMTGLTLQYLLPARPVLNNQLLLVAGALSYTAFGAFTLSYLDAARTLPAWLVRSLRLATAANALAALPALFGSYTLAFALSIPPALGLSALACTAGALGWRAGRREARFFLTAFLLLFMGVFVFYLAALELLPTTALTENALMGGTAAGMLLLSAGLADRVNTLKADALASERRARDAQAALNTELERLVAERTTQLEEANRLLAELATTDALTGAFNRRHFDAVLNSALEQRQRQHTSLALCLMDVDHFKLYNDHYGHTAGDDVLRNLCEAARGHLRRQGDGLFRVGGEEFGLLLSLQEPAEADAVVQHVEAIRGGFEQLRIPHAHNPPGVVTASFGLVLVVSPAAAPTPAQLYRVADELLYEAKRAGRNQVRLRVL